MRPPHRDCERHDARTWRCSVYNPYALPWFKSGQTDNFDGPGTNYTGFFYRNGAADVQCWEVGSSREPSAVQTMNF